MQRRVAKCHPFCMERKVINQITYGLVRGSTNKQDVSHQIQKIKEYYPNVKDFFIEDGVSGTLPRELRPTFQQAIATCKKEKARLVCTHLDRLGRNASDILNFYEEEIQKGKIDVEVIGCPLNPMTTPILVGVGSIERYLISERTKSALSMIRKEIQSNGFYITRDGKKITSLGSPTCKKEMSKKGLATRKANGDLFKDTHLPLVQRLKDEGLSLRGIAKELNHRGVKTIRGKDFNAMQVKIILEAA